VEQLLGAPQVGGLAHEGGVVDQEWGGELGGVVVAEVPERASFAVQAEQLVDEFDGDDLAVVQQGLGPALAEVGEVRGFQFVVHEAEYQEQEFLRGNGVSSGLAGVATVILAGTASP
jgi:hypothetical protein